jgi:tRNA U55 pseudouridine synthase TruB
LSDEGRDALLRPPDEILGQLPRVDLDEAAETRFCQGQALVVAGIPPGVCRVYGALGRFLGLAEEREEGLLSPKRLLGERNAQDSPTG